MRFIPTSVHGIADYLVCLGMIILAFVAGAQGAGFAAFVILGVFGILYSLFTDYELGWKSYLSMPAHLALDAGFAVVMLVLPFLVDLPPMLHRSSFVIAVLAAVLVLTTRMQPGSARAEPMV
ncbi:hypothetical protein M0654_21865 [Rhizobium sp. NTR19]|uniref:SPW repeat-containing protein n=1 Tax=Neorhizobium turbinariae TaxID=2937795 RepID=A0ABT0IXQ6_9HYPH|nr:hypothetical protein [Neorhizobium turbinariae]MCK8782619.1 hypothetical protein [Neorhizobium turbinariae]